MSRLGDSLRLTWSSPTCVTARTCATAGSSGSSVPSPQERHADHPGMPVVRFRAVILQDCRRSRVIHITENFYIYTDGNDLAILLNKDTFVSGSAVLSISEASTSKDTRRLAALNVRGLLRGPHPRSRFNSVHLHNKVAKKRDASTSALGAPASAHDQPPRRLHQVVTSTCSAFSTVGDVFPDPELCGARQLALVGRRRLGRHLS